MQKQDMAVHLDLQRTSTTIAEEGDQIAQGCGLADVWEGDPVKECIAGKA